MYARRRDILLGDREKIKQYVHEILDFADDNQKKFIEEKKRTLAKNFTWQTAGIFLNMGIGWILTSNSSKSFEYAMIILVTNVVQYWIHERLWDMSKWGKGTKDVV